ncbi:Ig-like domain-containing protein [Parapedobacter composti]|uniref:Ig-like domain-containing protein n=1 Tax=Parapedobacter composti TaxID=623281 RepID=UPI001B8B9D50|nr:gliding motility-associated C-terminal domain-containing protein [Parapedobacter composti]
MTSLRVYEVSRLPRVSLIEDASELAEILTGCGSVDLVGAITNYQPDYYDYHYYSVPTGGTPLGTSVVTTGGTYYIEAVDKVTGCISPRVAVTATVNAYPEITFNGPTTYVIAPGGSVTLPTASVTNVATTSIQWYDHEGNAYTPSGAHTFPMAGVYPFYVVATSNAGCQSVAAVVVIVSGDGCPPAFIREYNTGQSHTTTSLLGIPLGSVDNANAAADGDISTYATLNETLNVLGLTGETSQTLTWNTAVNAGTPVTVKLGREYGVASVVGNIYVAPVDAAGNEVGPRVAVDPNLAAVVNGLNVFEYTFVPTGSSGSATAYSGVKVIMSSLVNAVQSVRVYGAYYHNIGTADCSGGDVIDVYGGYEEQLLNLNALTGLIGVNNPEGAADRDLATYATLQNIAGVAAYSKLEVAFATPSLATDSLQIVFGEPGSLIDLNLLGEFRIQRFFGNIPVEDPVVVDPSLLRLRLLAGSSFSVVTVPADVPFDRVRITYGGTASVLESLRIYEVSRKGATQLPGTPNPALNSVEICVGGTVDLSGLPADCGTTYKIYDQPFGGSEVDIAALAAGTHTLWIQPVRYGCESLGRGILTVVVSEPPVAPVVAPTGNQLVAAGTSVTLEITNAADYATGTTYQWFKDGVSLDGETGATLTIADFASADEGAYTAVAIGLCASPASAATNLALLDLDTWMSADQTSVRGGEEITYTIHIRNNSTTTDATGLTVTGAVPDHTTFVSVDADGTHDNGVVTFADLNVPAGETITVSFKVRVDDDLTGVTEISNVATVKSGPDDPGQQTWPPNAANDGPDESGDRETVVPVEQVNTVVSWKSYAVAVPPATAFNPAITSVSGGETIAYTVYVRNTGNQRLTNIAVSDQLPAGVTWVSGGTHDAGTVTFTIPSLEVGATSTGLTFNVLVNRDLTGIDAIRNVAMVTVPGETPVESYPPVDNSTPTDPDVSAGTGTVIDVTPVHDADISLTGVSNGTNSGQAAEGDEITYTITVENTGNKALTGVNVSGLVPANTAYVAGSGGSLNGTAVDFGPVALAVGETRTFTYKVTVGAIDASIPTIDNTATVTYRNADDTDDVTETADFNMPTSCDEVVASDITLSVDQSICVGETVTLTAAVPAGIDASMVKWYTNPGRTGTPLTGLSVEVTPTATATYYVVVEGVGYCFNGAPAEVTVTVNPRPEAATITVTGDATVCAGETVTLTATPGADSYIWYQAGVEVQNGPSNTFEANESGNYTVVVVNTSGCSSPASAAVEVVVRAAITAPSISASGDLTICQGSSVELVATTAPGYQWFLDGTEIPGATERTLLATQAGVYTVIAVDGDCVSPASAGVTVTVTESPVVSLNGPLTYAIEVGQSVPVPTYTVEAGVTYQWVDGNGNNFNGTAFGPFSTAGVYSYTLVATRGGCSSAVTVVINVYNEGECPPVFDRVYNTAANNGTVASLLGLVTLGSVDNPQNAASADVTTYSTIAELLSTSLLGLTGETSQTLTWNSDIPAGTPVTVKLAKEYGAAGVIGGLYVQAVDGAGNPVGGRQWVDPNLASVVNGLNVFEYTFAPTGNYRGVKVALSAVLNAAQSARIYNAYYHQAGTPDCSNPDGVRDVLEGVEFPLGIANVLTGLAGVENPRAAADGDEATFATLRNNVGVNALTKLEVAYAMPALAGDTVSIRFSKPGSVLTAGLLESFTIQPYLGNTAAGDPVHNNPSLLRIELLPGGQEGRITYTADVPFDRIKILYGGIASVVDELRIHEVSRTVPAVVTGPNNDNTFEICAGEDITIDPDDCTAYTIYTTAAGNTVADITALPAGTHTLYVQTVRFGSCEIGERTPITVTVKANGTPADIDAADIVVCFGENAVLNATSSTVTDSPVFNWYSDEQLTDLLFTGAAYDLGDALAVGVHTYYVTVQSATVCENAPGNAAEVSVIVQRQITAADISVPAVVSQCSGEDVVITAAIAGGLTISNPVFNWYFDAAGTQPISDGTVGGVTYTVGIGTLTVSGLADGANPTYYVQLSGDDVCENVGGDLAAVEVAIGDALSTPVVPAVAVCPGDDVTLAVQSPQSNLTYNWYDAASGGSLLHTGITYPLTGVTASATYYVEAVGTGGCVSATRTAVTVTVNPFATASDVTVSGTTDLCAPGSTVLTPATTLTGTPVFRWYADANKTTEITSGVDADGVLTLSGLVAGTYTYYVSVSSEDFCENEAGDLTAVAVTVTEVPEAPVVTPPVQYVVVGGTVAPFQAVGVTSGSVVWYSDAGLTTAVHSGESFVPSSAAVGTFTYYVVVEAGPCASAATEVVLHVTAPPTAPDDCYVANAESHGADGLCVLCAVLNPTHAVDADRNNYTRLSIPVGLLDGSVYQRLQFSHAGKGGDTVHVDIAVPGGLADVSILGGLSFTLYNGGSAVATFSGNDPLLRVTLLSGSRGMVRVPAPGAFDRIEVRNTAGIATLLTSVDIYGAEIHQASPTLPSIPDPLELCQGENYTLNAEPAAGTYLRWYDAGGTLLHEGSDFVVPTATAGNYTYYIEIVDAASHCPDPDRIPVRVRVIAAPTAADIVADGAAICAGESFTLSATLASGSAVTDPVFTWYADAALTTEITDLTVSPATTTTYYVTVKSGAAGCENMVGDAKEVTVTVTPRATAGDITVNDATICAGESVTLSATSAVADAVFRFYADAALTTEITDLTVSPSVTTTYYVTVSGDGVCENAPNTAAELTVTVTPRATAGDITVNDATICAGESVTLSATSAVADAVFRFYADAALTTEITDLTVSPSATTTYYVTVSGDGVCENAPNTAAELTVTVTPRATAGDITVNDATICAGESVTLSATSAVANAVFRFYADAALTTEITDLTVSPSVTTTYYVTVSGDGVCENAPNTAAELTVTVTPRATAGDITVNDATICAGESVTLSATSAVADAVFRFYADAALTTEITDLTVSPSVTTTYYVTVSGDGVCENAPNTAAELTVTVTPRATAGDITVNDATICAGESVTLSATSAVANAVFRFYADAALTTEITDLTVSPSVTTTYYVTVSGDGVCENAPNTAAELTVTVNPNAAADAIDGITVAGADATGNVCIDAGGNVTLRATLAVGAGIADPVFHWYDAAGNPVSGGANGELVLAGIAAGTHTYYVGVSGNGVCETPAADRTSVTFTARVCTDLAVVKTVDNTNPYVGDNVVFTITVTNNGPGAATGVVVTDELPTGYTYVSATATVGTFDAAAGTWAVGNLANGASQTLTITARVLAAGDYINYASVTGDEHDPDKDNNEDTPDDPVVPVPVTDLAIVKTVDNITPYVGDNVVFTVVVTNNGPSDATGVVVTDELPTGYTYVSATATVGTFDAAAGTWAVGNLANGASQTLTITARVLAAGDYINYASVTGDEHDPDKDNNEDTPDDPVVPIPVSQLSVTKVADQSRVVAGETTTFTITITNNGPSPIASNKQLALRERPGQGVTITGYAVTSGNATISGDANSATVATTEAIAVGETIVVKVTAAIDADAPATITNGISVWGPDKDPDDDTPDDEDDTPEIPVDRNYALSITKVADDARVISGGSTSFTVTVTNNGPSTIAAGQVISLREHPGNGVVITGYEVTAGNATVAGTGNAAELTATSAIPSGGTITVVVSADVTAPAGTTITNGIAVWAPDRNPDTEDEDDEDETPEIPVDRPYTLTIEKVADQSLVTAGQSTTFTVTITNNGPMSIAADRQIALEERPGAGVTVTGYEIVSGAATISGSGNQATITTTGTVDVGATIVVRVTATVAETATGTITNGIAVWSPGRDPEDEDPDDEDETNPIPVDAALEIPNLFTPNGDGLNDRFVIKNLMQYQGRELLILNRWGNQVYKSTNYNNDWDGGSLAEGTYYYILRVRGNNNGEWRTYKGAVAIIRVTGR